MKSRKPKALISATGKEPSGLVAQKQNVAISAEVEDKKFDSFLKNLTTPSTQVLDPFTEKFEAFPPELKAKLSLEKGRLFFTVKGVGIKASRWEGRLTVNGHKLSKYSADILSKPVYDQYHRLEAGKTYKLGLVFGGEIPNGYQRATKAWQEIGFAQIGKGKPKAELAFLIREKFTNDELKLMGLRYIAVLHTPIVDSKGFAKVFISEHSGESSIGAHCAGPENIWLAVGACAFLASAQD